MAIGHRYLGPRWVVLPTDPAVDEKASDAVRYQTSLYKEGLVIKESHKPTRFQISPLTVRQKRYAVAKEFDTDLIIRCGLVAVENFVVELEDGTITTARQPDRKDRGGEMGVCASSEWADEFQLHLRDRSTLAGMILAVTEPDPLSCKPSDAQSGGSESSEKESTA